MSDLSRAAAELDLDGLRRDLLELRGGEVDDSIPTLAAADADVCGVALALRDGTVHASADTDLPFSIQSAVKPFIYALALTDRGDEVHDAVGIEPTGEAFDAIRLESGSGRAPNPMVNAGALLTANLVDGDTVEARTARIRDGLARFAGTDLAIDEAVLEEEQAHGDRNHALAHLLRSEGTLPVGVDDAVAAYASACAVTVTTRALAVMGATLACAGRNPVSGEQVVPPQPGEAEAGDTPRPRRPSMRRRSGGRDAA